MTPTTAVIVGCFTLGAAFVAGIFSVITTYLKHRLERLQAQDASREPKPVAEVVSERKMQRDVRRILHFGMTIVCGGGILPGLFALYANNVLTGMADTSSDASAVALYNSASFLVVALCVLWEFLVMAALGFGLVVLSVQLAVLEPPDAPLDAPAPPPTDDAAPPSTPVDEGP